MKQSFINRITLCDKCKTAFIINVEGDNNTCESCLDKQDELYVKELLEEGVIQYPNNY